MREELERRLAEAEARLAKARHLVDIAEARGDEVKLKAAKSDARLLARRRTEAAKRLAEVGEEA